MFKFEWDYRKAESNAQKHGVSFEEAVSVFADTMALTFSDSDHSKTEDRRQKPNLRHVKQGAFARGGSHRAKEQYQNH